MIHHVKQKLRLNLNTNVVDAIVHLNVKATAVQQTFARQAGTLGPRPTPPSESFLPGPLLTPVSAILHLGHVLSLPGCFSLARSLCLSARHLPPIITSLEEPRLVLCSGLRRQIQRCSRCPSARYDCLNRTSVSCLPSGYLAMQQLPVTTRVRLVCLGHSVSEEMLGLPLIGCDCGLSRMQS